MNILLDLDGVMSDFFSAALSKLNKELGRSLTHADYQKLNTFDIATVFGISPAQFWDIIEDGQKFWWDLQPFPWAKDLLDFVETLGEVTICTTPSLNPDCCRQKTAWCEKYLNRKSDHLMIGGRKYLMARSDCLLIDDYPENVKRFHAAGGRAVLVPSNWNTPELDYEKVILAITAPIEL